MSCWSSKDSESNQALAAQGAKILPFDAAASDAADHLHGIDVLISTVGALGIGAQIPLVHSAKKAGVQLFVPAEWGDDSDGRELPILKLKVSVREEARQVGLPFAAFFHGPWSDFLPLVHEIDHFPIESPSNSSR
jgi:hypothetical protein